MERFQKFLIATLLVFTFISIGFSLGKHNHTETTLPHELPHTQGQQVAVYYLHSSFRCITCNTIEEMTRNLLDHAYASPLAEQTLLWREVDFQTNEALAKQFDVIASCVVVAHLNNGQVTEYQRLDEVWTLMKDPQAFNQYISQAIDTYLEPSGDPT
ncbi:nitrophenyl compound nitroreductase subunit ArsF family protein [Kiritimatiellota bacterium B12222]|nr:nitrophenyl compound nitroreductase subunit ArsF family protein [Kiritimatiellota bacterium B12222]